MMSDKHDGEILFKPVCGKCGTIIEQKVDLVLNPWSAEFENKIFIEHYDVIPRECPYCRTRLRTIVMISDFPYEGYDGEFEGQ